MKLLKKTHSAKLKPCEMCFFYVNLLHLQQIAVLTNTAKCSIIANKEYMILNAIKKRFKYLEEIFSFLFINKGKTAASAAVLPFFTLSSFL